MLKSRVTKKDIQTLVNLIEKHGYWSEQVREYNGKFTYPAMQRLQNKARIIIAEKNNVYQNVL